MIQFLKLQGLQQQYQYSGDSDGDGYPDRIDKFPGKSDFYELKNQAREAVQDVAGLLVGEYYHDRDKFANDHALVKEIQSKLASLNYDIGKTGVDGKLGAKTKTAMHNFEQDHAEEVKNAATVQQSIKKGREK